MDEICRVLVYLHQKGIYHRDLRAANILLDKELNIKIGDFGIAVIQGVQISEGFSKLGYIAKNIYKSEKFLQPRILDVKKTNSNNYSQNKFLKFQFSKYFFKKILLRLDFLELFF